MIPQVEVVGTITRRNRAWWIRLEIVESDAHAFDCAGLLWVARDVTKELLADRGWTYSHDLPIDGGYEIYAWRTQ